MDRKFNLRSNLQWIMIAEYQMTNGKWFFSSLKNQ